MTYVWIIIGFSYSTARSSLDGGDECYPPFPGNLTIVLTILTNQTYNNLTEPGLSQNRAENRMPDFNEKKFQNKKHMS